MSAQHKEVLFGIYNDDSELISAIRSAKKEGLDIMDAFMPFPVHGMDDAMEFEESRLHIAGFVFGSIGALTGFGFMTWVFTRDWPIIFGGKPYWSVPAFIPITFELTVLFAAIGMVVTFYTICGLGPGVINPILDDRITDDKFCLAFQTNGYTSDEVDGIKGFLQRSGAAEIHTKVI